MKQFFILILIFIIIVVFYIIFKNCNTTKPVISSTNTNNNINNIKNAKLGDDLISFQNKRRKFIPEWRINSFKPNNKDELTKGITNWLNDKDKYLETYGYIGYWDISKIKDMSTLFKDKKNFNDNINFWDVSNVTNMEDMFAGTDGFNQPLDKWDVSNVTNMNNMFNVAKSFDQTNSNNFANQVCSIKKKLKPTKIELAKILIKNSKFNNNIFFK